MSIDILKLEELTEARRKTWIALHAAIGADHAAAKFAKVCQAEMNSACAADERANQALFDFVRLQAENAETSVQAKP